MLVVIGMYYEGKKFLQIEGLKIYDTESKKIGLFPKSSVYQAVLNGRTEVVGVKVHDKDGKRECRISCTNEFNASKLDRLDEYGFKTGDGKPDHKVVLMVEGFGKNTVTELVDCNGCIERVKYVDFIKMIREGKIVGAYADEDGTVRYNKYVKRNGVLCECG